MSGYERTLSSAILAVFLVRVAMERILVLGSILPWILNHIATWRSSRIANRIVFRQDARGLRRIIKRHTRVQDFLTCASLAFVRRQFSWYVYKRSTSNP